MPDNFNMKSDDITEVGRGQAVVEVRRPLDTECKVLSVAAAAAVTPGEVFTGEARYAGQVRFDCLVIADGKIDCVSAVADFSDKITSPDISGGMNPIIISDVINTEAVISDGTLKMTAVVDTSAMAAVHCDKTCLKSADGVYTDTRPVSFCTVISDPSDVAYITDVLSDVKASEVLNVRSQAVITGAECTADEVCVSGAVYTFITVKTDDGLAASYRVVTPFVKSISAPGITSAEKAVAYTCVKESSAVITEDGDMKNLEISVTLAMNTFVLEENTVDAVMDAFCAENEIEVGHSDARICKAEPAETVTDSIDGQVTLDADALAADNVLCVSDAFCTVSEARIDDGRVSAEGLVGGDVVYYNAESNKPVSVAFRIPFSMPIDVHTDCDNIALRAAVTDCSVKIRRGSVFDIKADIAFTAYPVTHKTVSVVDSIKIGDPIARPDATVIVHIAKPGETLWQAAKALCCSPERVTEQNAAPAPYSGGERLISFVKKSDKLSASHEA